MKKFLFWTALASVALTGCVKNDVEPNPSLGQDVEITFNKPVVGKITRAHQPGLMDTDYKQEEKFAVTAWAHEKDFKADDAEIKPYIDKVMAYYKPSATATPNVGIADGGTGGWVLATPYYWPKTHKLTFSAYSPYELPGVTDASVTVDKGITLKGVTTPDLVADHYDMLFSTRVYDQKETSYVHTNVDYIGVDIVFNHALSAIVVKACLDKTYADNNAIKINSIKFDNVMTVGDFYENITNYKTLTGKSTTAYWDALDVPKDNFYIGQTTTADLQATPNTITYGIPAMFIPQTLANTEGNIQMVVNYTITNTGGISLNETLTFDLSDLQDTSVSEWEIGKRYTYTLTFSLNEIVLAPSVDDWTDVPVSVLDDEDQILP